MGSSDRARARHQARQPRRGTLLWLWAGYTLLLVYATWFPLDNWDWSRGGLQEYLIPGISAPIPRSDAILNLLVYIPFGVLGMLCLRQPLRWRPLLVTGIATGLSAVLEFGQTYLPARISSAADLALNSTGTLLGALLTGTLIGLPLSQRTLARFRQQLKAEPEVPVAIVALCTWLLSQWAPLVPSLDPGHLWQSLAPVRATLAGEAPLSLTGTLRYLSMMLGLGALCLTVFTQARIGWLWLLLLVGLGIAGRVLVAERVLSAHALLGMLMAPAVLLALTPLHRSVPRLLALIGLLGFLLLDNLTPAASDTSLRTLNWVPFSGHMNRVSGVVNLLEVMWVYMALAWVAAPWTNGRRSRWALTIAVAAGSFGMEWLQQSIAGRFPDITEVIVATLCWWLASGWPIHHPVRQPATRANPARTAQHPALPLLPWLLLALAGLTLAWINLRPDPPRPYQLPAATELPAPDLPGWRQAHPRLPAPSAEDLAILQRDNPAFLERHRKAAARGRIEARIMMANLEPGSVDLDALFRDLTSMRPGRREVERTRLLALAYDWLHDKWPLEQRRQLLGLVESACSDQISVITEREALSPYNVQLYTGPLQALMTAAIASHADGGTDHCMRFTADYWQHRILPVWRQVMGQRGGWHEGGEHVGMGIGQAIYQLPALWRRATGEDLFLSEPGLRGFLDFAVHRTRPDGTHIRLGDAAWFQRNIPDLAALALEFRHEPAYRLAAAPARPEPLAWPWGPLSRPALEDAEDDPAPPTGAYFDGIGLLLARSDWSREATFVSFKAGNHFWSHAHLDQGAFTIFHGGALALDSGLYDRPGSEHHSNYSAQSIAHNLVTVTDPEDILPMPGQMSGQAPRPIANDGGQRRVGSGWGRPAPLDLQHWLEQEEHYRTVGMTRWGDDGTHVWKVADLTPAYTSSRSGRGDFAERTRRVEHYQRSFVFDRQRKLVVVHDRIASSDPGFRKRWLLHSRFAPAVDDQGFVVELPPDLRRELRGGRLVGRVLLPEAAQMVAIGGPGFEFFVDSANYDNNGALRDSIPDLEVQRGAEPGAWRLEIQPPEPGIWHEFLVVMQIENFGDPLHGPPPLELELRGEQRLLHIGGERAGTLSLPASLNDPRVRWTDSAGSAARR